MRSLEKAFADVIGFAAVASGFEPAHLKRARQLVACEVEFGLYAQSQLMPDAAAEDAWVLFSGYPHRAAWYGSSIEADLLERAALRYTLWTLRSARAWREALEEYRRLDAPARAFDIPDIAVPAVPKNVSIAAAERSRCYSELLRCAPPFAGEPQEVAAAGRHVFSVGRGIAEVELPATDPPAVAGHDFDELPRGGGAPLSFAWDELVRTAARMNAVHNENWVNRLLDIRVLVRHKRSFRRMRRQRIRIDGIQHLLGIVGAGKSTLRDVLAVHMAKRGLRTTIIIGDVAEQLKLVALYNLYVPDKAAPVIGGSGRESHAQRLHNRFLGRGEPSVLLHDDAGFDHLSTSCAIAALPTLRMLNGTAEERIPYQDAPCTRLVPQQGTGSVDVLSRWNRRACPFWSRCPRHHSSRRLVDADIWVATPASLIASPVPWPQNAERTRYLELACRRSDLVIVDEADRVQMQLDEMFAPTITLVGDGGEPSFLDAVIQHKNRELPSRGRTQLANREVEKWSAALTTVELAADRLYAMLVRDENLRKWVRVGYFNAWNLQLKLASERYSAADDPASADGTARDALNKILDDFRDNPFGDRRRTRPETADDTAALTGIVNELLHTADQRLTRERLVAVLEKCFDVSGLLDELGVSGSVCAGDVLDDMKALPVKDVTADVLKRLRWLRDLPGRFEFTLLLSVIEPRLALITMMWPRVASMLDLGFNKMYRRPPDYGPMVPEAPMGNLIGFQFVAAPSKPDEIVSGELRFFWNSGVGRELLRKLSHLPRVDGRPRTNVLLMSGSSWAGSSTRYHIDVPVGIMLEPPREDIKRITDHSRMTFEPLLVGGNPLRLSGTPLEQRPTVLRRMTEALGSPNGDLPSRLEWELHSLEESRRHLLLLVGSYEEARLVADHLHGLDSYWRDKVLCLVRDDASVPPADDHHAGALRRGDVETLASTTARVLVAPLLAVERGHNILDKEKTQAAIGTVFFLAKPNPRPDDLVPAVYGINAWAVRKAASSWYRACVRSKATVGAGAHKFRDEARKEWYRLLSRSMTWRGLGDDRDQVTWDLLVLIWQVIGRLVRGGVEARVVFVDASFAPNAAEGSAPADTRTTSLLYSMAHVLRPYFERGSAVTPHDRRIVNALYKPLWVALGRCLDDIERNAACIP